MVTCRFLENFRFASLLAPVTEEEFRERYWEQKPLIVHRGDPNYYGDLYTLQDFDQAVARSFSYVKTVDVSNRKVTSKKPATVNGQEAVLADMRDGGSLILEQLQRYDPKLGLLCRLLAQELGHSFETNLFLTPPRGKSSLPHWDNTDVFTLQVLGSKHWQIEKERRLFPIRPHRMGGDDHKFQGDVLSFTVEQGDLIYIPRGFFHTAECGPEVSLHISLGLVPTVIEDLLHAIIKAAVSRDERLRVALPLGFLHGNGERIAEDALRAFREAVDESLVSAVVEEFRDDLIKTYPLDISSQISDFFQPSPLTVEDVVGPRRGIVYRVRADEAAVRLNVGERCIVFPGFFREALGFALNTPAFKIRDVAGELEDEERLVFIERLIQEGLVVRK